jgi:hypothetical protein
MNFLQLFLQNRALHRKIDFFLLLCCNFGKFNNLFIILRFALCFAIFQIFLRFNQKFGERKLLTAHSKLT